MAHEAGAPRAEEAEILPLHCRENAGTPTGPPEGRHIFCVLGEDGDEFVELGPVAGVSVAEDKLFDFNPVGETVHRVKPSASSASPSRPGNCAYSPPNPRRPIRVGR